MLKLSETNALAKYQTTDLGDIYMKFRSSMKVLYEVVILPSALLTKLRIFSHALYLYVSCDSQNKVLLFI
jgi:hypothetical protein